MECLGQVRLVGLATLGNLPSRCHWTYVHPLSLDHLRNPDQALSYSKMRNHRPREGVPRWTRPDRRTEI